MDRKTFGKVPGGSATREIIPFMNTEDTYPYEFRSLHDIRRRKKVLMTAIKEDDGKIKALWKDLFKKPDALSRNATPGKRFSSIITNGMGLIDGAILGWKLYRKFKKHKR